MNLQLKEGQTDSASSSSKELIMHRFKALFPAKPLKKPNLSSSFHAPLKPSSHVKKLYTGGIFSSNYHFSGIQTQQMLEMNQRKAMATILRNSESPVYVTLQQLIQQVYVKYGVTCEGACLRNGHKISSFLEIPLNTKQIHLLTQIEPTQKSQFYSPRQKGNTLPSSQQQRYIPPRHQLSVLSNSPPKRTHELSDSRPPITSSKPPQIIQRPKCVSLHIQSLPPLTREIYEQQIVKQKNLEIQRISDTMQSTVRENIQAAGKKSNGKEPRGLDALSPQTREQIKEAILKRFPVAPPNPAQHAQGLVRKVSLHTMEAQFPEPKNRVTLHQPQQLRSTLKQHSTYRQVAAAMAAKLQEKSKGFQRRAYLTHRPEKEDLRAESSSDTRKDALQGESLDQILKMPRVKKDSVKELNPKLKPIRQSPGQLMAQTFHQKHGLKFNRDLDEAGVQIQSIAPSQTIYQHYNSLDPIQDKHETHPTDNTYRERPSSEHKQIREEYLKQNMTASQAIVMLNGSQSPHHQFAILDSLRANQVGLKRDSSSSAIINELRMFSFSPANLDKNVIQGHQPIISPSPQQLSPLRPLAKKRSKFLSPQRTLKNLHKSESRSDVKVAKKKDSSKFQKTKEKEKKEYGERNSEQIGGIGQETFLDTKSLFKLTDRENTSILDSSMLQSKQGFERTQAKRMRGEERNQEHFRKFPLLNQGKKPKKRNYSKGRGGRAGDVALSISGNARELISTRNYLSQKAQLAEQRQDLVSMLGLSKSVEEPITSDLFKNNVASKMPNFINMPNLSENIKRGLVENEHQRNGGGASTSIEHRNPHTLLLTTSLEHEKLKADLNRNKTPLLSRYSKPRYLSKPLRPLHQNTSSENLKIAHDARSEFSRNPEMRQQRRHQKREHYPSKPMVTKPILPCGPTSSLSNKKFYFLRLCRPPLSGGVKLNQARATFFYLKNLQSRYELSEEQIFKSAEQFDFILKVSRGHWLKLKGAIFQTVDNAHYQIESQAITVQQFKLHSPLFSQISRMVCERILFALNINALSDSALVSLDRFILFEALFTYRCAPLSYFASFLSAFINNKSATQVDLGDINRLFKLIHKESGVNRPIFLADLEDFLSELNQASVLDQRETQSPLDRFYSMQGSLATSFDASMYEHQKLRKEREEEGKKDGIVKGDFLQIFLNEHRSHTMALFEFICGN